MFNTLDVSSARRKGLPVALGLLFLPGLAGAAPKWVEVRSEHFIAISDAGDGSARRMLWQFEQIRAAVKRVWPWASVDTGEPFYIFAARSEETLKTLAPHFWEGKRFRPGSFGATGRDRRFIAVRTDLAEPSNPDENPYQSAYWSYVSSVLARSFPGRLPQWYQRGVSEVWSNTRVREKEIHVGRVIQANVERARRGGLIRLDDFLSADGRSHWLTQAGDITLFDAQAWAFVHYLMFGESGAHSQKFSRFSGLLMNGVPQEQALLEAFGDPKPLFDKIHMYVNQSVLPFARIGVTLDLDVKTFGSRVMSPVEVALARAELHVALNRPVEARALAAEAAQADPSSPGPSEVEAQLLEREGKRDEAREAFARAVELGSQRAFVHYRLAQLRFTQNADAGQLGLREATLRRAHELDPTDANVMSFLAETLAAQGRLEDAAALGKKAVEADPTSSYHRLVMARIARDLGRLEDAIAIAESAVAAADDDAERSRAQQYVAWLKQQAPPARP
jgi:tetratricopeptide (TPR) repeat protein